MLISQEALSKTQGKQGSSPLSFAELRRRLGRPSGLNDAHRQRLRDLSRRAARVRALGDEYAGVELSEHVKAALGEAELV